MNTEQNETTRGSLPSLSLLDEIPEFSGFLCGRALETPSSFKIQFTHRSDADRYFVLCLKDRQWRISLAGVEYLQRETFLVDLLQSEAVLGFIWRSGKPEDFGNFFRKEVSRLTQAEINEMVSQELRSRYCD